MTETARQIPLIFGGMSEPAYARMAHWGEGYVGASVPANMVSEAFDGARTARSSSDRCRPGRDARGPGGGQTETKYISWAKANMRLWQQIVASLDDDDVVDLLTEVDVKL